MKSRQNSVSTTVDPDRAELTLTIPLAALSGLTVIAPRSAMLSQLNVEHELGMPPRTYLEMIRAPGFPVSVKCVGKLRFVHREDFIAHLDTLTARPPSNGSPKGEEGADDVEAVLQEMGYERVSASKKRRRAR